MLFIETPFVKYQPLSPASPFNELVEFFRRYPQASLCPVTDVSGRPVGYVSLRAYQKVAFSPFGQALNHHKGITSLISQAQHVASLTDEVREMFNTVSDKTELLSAGLLLVNGDGNYVGCLNARGVFDALNSVHANMLRDLKSQIQERERAEFQIKRLADTDTLTGILNRRAFVRGVEELVTEERRFVCAFVDLDRFKPLNDKYGHGVGDAVLKLIATRLESHEGISLACRLGGDEFAFALKGADIPTATRLVEDIHLCITNPMETTAGLVSVGASIGFAAFPDDANEKAALLHAADKAMMRIKAAGGGVAEFDRNLDLSSVDAEAYEKAVAAAVTDRSFKPAVQPVINLATREVVGYEMLARWPNSGFSTDPTPAQFIPAIERLGLMDSFFWSLFEQALDWLPENDSFLALNVSPSQLTSVEFVDTMCALLEKHAISPTRIELEITEHVVFRNLEKALEVLHRLNDLGVSLALDDFGTGYSSLSLLEELPLKKVKLDRSLLGKPGDATTLSRVLRATLKLCDELELSTCAEGIESECQIEALTHHGCHLAQGFQIGRPILCGDRVMRNSSELTGARQLDVRAA